MNEMNAQTEAGNDRQYLTFQLGTDTYAVSIMRIKEIIEHGVVTHLPMMPRFMHGVINLRGKALPVIDLSSRLQRGTTEIGRRTCIVILEVASSEGMQDLGILVDAVNQVVDIPASEIEPAPQFGLKMKTEFIAGMGKVDDKFVILLNTDQLLSLDEMAALTGNVKAAA